MIYIWVRHTVPWEDEQAFLAQVNPRFKPKVDTWNETFSIPYNLFRHRVREIARQSLSVVEDTVVADWDEIPDGALVAPLDDDDWFAPELGHALEHERDPALSGYRWVNGFLQVPMYFGHRIHLLRRRFLGAPAKLTCTTNNYALVKREGIRILLSRHVLAGNWFGEQEPGAVTYLDRRLSVMNRTVASQTQMGGPRPYVTRSELVRKANGYRRLYENPRLGDDLAWCRPYVEMMAALMDELKVR
jgi:hypothetical protein